MKDMTRKFNKPNPQIFSEIKVISKRKNLFNISSKRRWDIWWAKNKLNVISFDGFPFGDKGRLCQNDCEWSVVEMTHFKWESEKTCWMNKSIQIEFFPIYVKQTCENAQFQLRKLLEINWIWWKNLFYLNGISFCRSNN